MFNTYGQNLDKENPPVKPTQLYLFNVFEKTLEVLRVKVVSGNIVVSPDTNMINSQLSRYTSTKNALTLNHAGDSLAFAPRTLWARIMIESKGDTLEVAHNSAYTNSVIVYPNAQYSSDKKSVAYLNKVYFRGYGGGSTLPYQIVVEGW